VAILSLFSCLESLEFDQINLGLYTTHVTAEDLQRAKAEAEGTALPLNEVGAAVRDLVAQGEVIEWAPGLFRSRIAETVRCLRLLRQRLWRQKDLSEAPLLVEDVRVEFRQRKRPKRDAVPSAEVIPPGVSPEVACAFLDAVGFSTFSGFQARAIEQVFTCVQQSNTQDESFIISGDTGAGKTEAFLFPILLDIASEPPELRAVLVYPRMRLARNQLARLLRYTGRFHAAGDRRMTIGIQNGDVPSNIAAIRKWTTKQRMDASVTKWSRWKRASNAEIGIQGDTGNGSLICQNAPN
jgi:hypothetical protein